MSIVSCSTTTTTAYKVTADTTGTLVLQTGSTPTTAATFDANQNMGLGVTPSAWGGTGVRAFQISGYGSFAGSVGSVDIYNNAYYDGSAFKYISSNPATRYSQNTSGASHAWFNAGSGTAGNAISFTQAMTLDASGNLLVGTTSASGAKLRVYDGTIRCDSLSVNSTSAYFYQTSGAFTTGNAAKTAFYSESGVRSFGLGWLSDSGGSQAAWMTANSTNLGWVIQTDSANGVRLANTATSWSSYSDERLKNIIEEIPQALTKIAAIRAVRFSWKADEENTPKVGVIAQDVQAVLPEVVDDDTDFMQVRYSELVPLCIKAIQEQQAIIETLTNRITALEAK
jgi:hypothetical protein